jgi:sortase A
VVSEQAAAVESGQVDEKPDDDPTGELPSVAEDAAPAARRVGPPRPTRAVCALAGVMLICVTVAFLGVFFYGLSTLQEQRSQHLLYSEFRGALDPSSPNGPAIGGAIRRGTPVALLNVPAAGMHDVVVVEGSSSSDLVAGPGHRPDTALPGQPGESLLVGRSTTAGGPFRNLKLLAAGDRIDVLTGQGDFHYPTSLLYVSAELDGKAVAAPPGRPTHVPASELPGGTDGTAWWWIAAWAVALIAASIATWWLWARWGILRAWIVAAPVLFWVMWELALTAERVLPNVY